MKIRNLAFCGVMASILGMGGAYAATDATIIASKAYVDARDNTKQDNLGGGATAGKVVTATSTAGTVDYTGIDSTVTANSTNLVTSGAVASAITSGATDAINALDLTAEEQTGVIKTVTQTDGQVAVTSGTVNTNDITNGAVAEGKIADSAVTAAKLATDAVETNKIKNGAVTTDKIADSSVTMPKTDFIVKQGDSTKAWNEASEAGETEAEKALAKAAKRGEEDKYVPTLSAVESRITAAVGAGTSALDYTIASGDHVDGRPVVAVTETDGIIAVTEGQITNAGVADNAAITTNKMGAITGYTISSATGADRNLAATDTLNVALGKLEKKADDNATTVEGLDLTAAQNTGNGQAVVQVTQTNGQVAAAKGILDYDKAMNAGLSEINTRGGDGSSNCKVGSPCVLTMVMNGSTPVYEWTNMETDGLNADL